MSESNVIDFWFSIGSTYTYLSVSRLPHMGRTHGITFRWRPFNVRRIMREMDNHYLAGKPAKDRYMWRDIERRAAILGVPANVPVPYPLTEFDAANRVAILGMQQGWGMAYVRVAYLRWFRDRQEPGREPTLSETLREIGQDPAAVIAQARSNEVMRDYDAATNEARGLGIFGSPTFVVHGSEVFWGDDRLEHAINWLKRGRVA